MASARPSPSAAARPFSDRAFAMPASVVSTPEKSDVSGPVTRLSMSCSNVTRGPPGSAVPKSCDRCWLRLRIAS